MLRSSIYCYRAASNIASRLLVRSVTFIHSSQYGQWHIAAAGIGQGHVSANHGVGGAKRALEATLEDLHNTFQSGLPSHDRDRAASTIGELMLKQFPSFFAQFHPPG